MKIPIYQSRLSKSVLGAMVGFAIGDAMGATNEFKEKDQITDPVTDIIGGGWLHLNPGKVTDDTQMMLAVAEAVVELPDPRDSNLQLSLMCRNFISWYHTDPKDIGNACLRAIEESLYRKDSCDPSKWMIQRPNALGNGSLMRALYPLLYYHNNPAHGAYMALAQSALTHNNPTVESIVARYAKVMQSLINGKFPNEVAESKSLMEPTGHVLNTYNNALVHFTYTDSFEDCIVQAVNNGGDADTIAAIAGSIAGAYYGVDTIPQRWINQLDRDVMEQIATYVGVIPKL